MEKVEEESLMKEVYFTGGSKNQHMGDQSWGWCERDDTGEECAEK